MSEKDAHYRTGSGPARLHEPRPGPSSASGTSTLGKLRDVADDALDGAAQVAGKARGAAGKAREAVGQAYEATTDWAAETADSASRNIVYARRRSAAEFNRGRREVAGFVEENPIMIGVVGLAAGLLLGALLPRTRQEDQYLGRYADEVRNQGLRYAQEAVEQGRSLLEENVRSFQQGRGGSDPSNPPARG